MTIVRAIGPGEEAAYREVRLAALADSPTAFTEPLAAAAALSDEVWSARVQSSIDGTTRVALADDEGTLVGLAAGIPFEGRARVVSVWVRPDRRRSGVAAALIENVCGWAATAGYEEIQIETAIGNSGPRRLYTALGFEPSDLPPPPGCDPVLVRRLR